MWSIFPRERQTLEAALAQQVPVPRWTLTRRGVIGTLAGGAGAVAVGLLDSLGGAVAEAVTPQGICDSSDDAGYVTWRSGGHNCIPTTAYDAYCSKGGCYREGFASNEDNCWASGYKARHRGCSESQTISGWQKEYQWRVNHCGNGFDGWEWTGTDDDATCGCEVFGSNIEPKWSCADGYNRTKAPGASSWSSWEKSICMKFTCVQV